MFDEKKNKIEISIVNFKMLSIIFCLILGILLGFLTREKRKILQISEKLADGIIYLFLFFFGLLIGSNKIIIENFLKLGIQSLVLAIGGISGSVFISFLLFKFLFKNE